MTKIFLIIMVAHMADGSVFTDIHTAKDKEWAKIFQTQKSCERELKLIARERGWRNKKNKVTGEFYIYKKFSDGEMMVEGHCNPVTFK